GSSRSRTPPPPSTTPTSSPSTVRETSAGSCGSPCGTWTGRIWPTASRSRERSRPTGPSTCSIRWPRPSTPPHEIGLVHRDGKPGNILLTRSDHAYLTDFGITKRREAGTEFTKTGDFLGSVDYAAPEQIRGERVDGRADVYALGCVVYECLVGEPPFAR